MDQSAFSGSGSFYLHRGMVGLGLGGSNVNLPFQSNIVNTSIESTPPIESYSTIPSNSSAPVSALFGEPLKRKRGRPRKYGNDGKISLAMPTVKLSSIPKRGRGRPRKQQLPSLGQWLSGSTGLGFTANVISIAVGQDITRKIMSFSQQDSRAICILSANGALSTVTLCQPSSSSGTVTYEGCFEILCLSGLYLPNENSGQTGGLSVTLASPDGRVIGGAVGGVLIAASSVQVIVGSFVCKSSKGKNKAGENQDSARNSDGQTLDNLPVNQASLQPSQNLTTTSMAAWHGSQ